MVTCALAGAKGWVVSMTTAVQPTRTRGSVATDETYAVYSSAVAGTRLPMHVCGVWEYGRLGPAAAHHPRLLCAGMCCHVVSWLPLWCLSGICVVGATFTAAAHKSGNPVTDQAHAKSAAAPRRCVNRLGQVCW